jgi:hypothetical protein
MLVSRPRPRRALERCGPPFCVPFRTLLLQVRNHERHDSALFALPLADPPHQFCGGMYFRNEGAPGSTGFVSVCDGGGGNSVGGTIH